MTRWVSARLGEKVEILNRKRVPLSRIERAERKGPYRYFGAQGVIDHIDGFLFDGEYLLVAEDGENLRSRKQPVASLVSGQFWVNNHAHILRAREGVANNRFLLHVVNSAALGGLITGAAQPKLTKANLEQLEFPCPPARTQDRIAALLGAFDELIEINERRIELLEELARSLYREWFVRFRFPGTERGAKREGLPAGWDKRPASDAGTFLNGYAFKPTDWGTDGPPIIKIKELRGGLSAATPRYVGNAVPSKYLVDRGDLLFSWSGHLGVYLWPNERGYLNQHLFKVSPTADLTVEWLFHALVSALPAFDARAQGTTMRHIKRSALTEVELVVPTRDILDAFTRSVRPLHRESLLLQHANQTLRTIRDLLLPRLVTGRLDISDIDLGVLLPEGVA